MEGMKKKEKTSDSPLLVVDDNPVIVKLLGAMLAQAGYPVTPANSGQQALALLESFLMRLEAARGAGVHRFLLMSATLGDMTFFAEELTRLNGRPTAVVRSTHRPVPLEFHYSEMAIHTTVSGVMSAASPSIRLPKPAS